MTNRPAMFNASNVTSSIKIHAEQLIRELGIADNGVYSEELGKLRAKELCERLDSLRHKAVASGMVTTIQSKFHRKGEEVVTDVVQRRKLAEKYTISEQAMNLCAIDRVQKQITIIAILRDKISNSRLYPTKRQKRKNAEIRATATDIADGNANLPYNFEDSTQIIKAGLTQVMDFISKDLDEVESVETRIGNDANVRKERTVKNVIEVDKNERISLANGDFYLRSECGKHLLWVEKATYFKAYAAINKLTLPTEDGIPA